MSSNHITVEAAPGVTSGSWERLSKNTGDCSVFHHPQFVSILAEVLGREVVSAVTLRGEDAVGGTLFLPVRRGPWMVASLPFFMYSPLLFLESQSPRLNRRLQNRREILDAIANWAEKQFAFTEMRLQPEIDDVRGFIWRRWQVSVEYTALLPLNEAWLDKADKDVRRILRNVSSGYKLTTDTKPAALYELLRKSYSTDRLNPPLPRNQFIRLLEKWVLAGLGEIYGITGPEGRLLSAAFILKSQPKIYGLFLGRDVAVPANHSTVILLSRVAEIFQRQGYLEFDLGGAMAPAIARFKENLGASIRPYYIVRHFSSPAVKCLYALKRLKGGMQRRRG